MQVDNVEQTEVTLAPEPVDLGQFRVVQPINWNSPRGLHVSPFPRRPAAFTPWNPARQASTHRKLTSSANSNRKHHPSKPTELGDGFDSGTDTGTNGQPQRPPAKRQRKNGDVSKRGRPRKGVQLLPGPAPIPLAIEKKKEAVRAPSPKPVPVEAPTPPVRKDKEHKKEPKKEPEPPRAPTPEEEYMGRPFPAFNPVLAKFPNYSWWIAVPLRPSTAPPWTQGRHSLTATLSDPAGRPYLVKSIPTGGDHRWALPSELRALDDSLIEQILTERYEEVPPRSWVKWRGELLEAIGIATNPTRLQEWLNTKTSSELYFEAEEEEKQEKIRRRQAAARSRRQDSES